MQLRFIVRGIGHRAATIWASSTATLFILFAAATRTEFVSTKFGCLQPDCLPAEGAGDTIASKELGAWPRRDLNPVGLLLAHRRNPARTTVHPLPLKAIRFVQYRTRTECRGSARLPTPLCWVEGRSSKNERAAS